jgi:hypothetical protein
LIKVGEKYRAWAILDTEIAGEKDRV